VQQVMKDYFRNIDTFLMGRKTWDVSAGQTKPASKKASKAKQPKEPAIRTYVFSRTLKAIDTPGVELVKTDAVAFVRNLKQQPGRFQYAMEALYELAYDGITASVMKSGVSRWFPYIGAVFFFVLVNNLVGLIPLPFGEHHQLSFYAATANLNVTITLALFTFVFTHYAGIRKHGSLAYFKNWMPKGAPPVLREFIFVIHIVSELFRLVSLSVRLFANMVAGHAILAVFFAMALIFQSYLAAVVLQGGSVVIYLFEIFVAFIQAFIFAILSAVYIGGALEEGH